jgi:hypothetical protein
MLESPAAYFAGNTGVRFKEMPPVSLLALEPQLVEILTSSESESNNSHAERAAQFPRARACVCVCVCVCV